MDFSNMLNKPLKAVELDKAKDEITFLFQDETSRRFGVEGDCCSMSWIEHITMPEDIRGAIITGVDEKYDATPWDGHVCDDEVNYRRACGHDYLQVYSTSFHTPIGDITLEYRNDSNGYYGGSLSDLT